MLKNLHFCSGLMLSLVLTACSPSTQAQVPKTAAETSESAGTAANNRAGIWNCDKFLEIYEACLTIVVPKAERAPLARLLSDTATAWRIDPNKPAGKDEFDTCKYSRDVMKMRKAMAPYKLCSALNSEASKS